MQKRSTRVTNRNRQLRYSRAQKMTLDAMPHTPFEALLDAAVDGIIVINDQGVIEIINPAAEQLFAYQNAELIGQNVSCLMPSPDSDRHNSYLEQYLSSGIRKMIGIGRKTVGKKKDASEFPMYLSVGHIDGVSKTNFVGIIRDLTDQEDKEQAILQSEKEIRLLRERLTHVARISTMGEMATGIAHEINQPLTAIATYAQASRRLLLSGATDSSDLLEALDKIDAQAQRASRVISSIRQLSKKHGLICKDYFCVDLISEVVALAETYAHEKGKEIVLNLSQIPQDQQVRVDLIQTQQVLLNLINNAIESMLPENDKPEFGLNNDVEIVVKQSASSKNILILVKPLDEFMLEVSVVDQGNGVDKAHSEQLFDAFFTTKPDGLGMGLSICHSIIASQGGDIYFNDNEFGGSTFSVTLPISIGQQD